MTGFWAALGAGLAFAVVEMAATYAVARRLRNAGIVDVVWSAGFAVLALLYLAWVGASGGLNPRAIVLTAMVVVWSLRLGGHLFVRVRAHHPVEDVRYAQLRVEWGAAAERRMFGFFQLQGALQVVLSVPFLLAVRNPHPPGGLAGPLGLGGWELAGLALWLVALAGEALSDAQLARFRGNPANRGRVCQEGLWRYSRHPNYFFEWLVWVAFWLFACGAPWGWVTIYAPALMLHFLLNVTGIPMTEELSVKSKGDAYREYQRTTSAFFPWFRR